MDTNWLYVLLCKCTADPLERIKLGAVILTEVSHRKISPHPKLVNEFLDTMSAWLTGSNFKVTIIGLEILEAALKTSPEVLASYYFDRIPMIIERMGDAKQQVRELAVNLLLHLAYLENSSPTMLLDRLAVPGTGLEHKQWMVKTGSLSILRTFLSASFALVIPQVLRIIPVLCRLTNDPNSEVRDGSSQVLVDLMSFGGQPVVAKIAGTRIIGEQKMSALMQKTSSNSVSSPKMDLELELGQPSRNSLLRRSLRSPAKIVYPSRLSTPPRSTHSPSVEPIPVQVPMVSSSGPTRSPNPPTMTTSVTNNGSNQSFGLTRSTIQPTRTSRDSTRSSMRAPAGISVSRYRSTSCAPAQCAVGQEDFRKAFSAVPKTTIYSAADIRDKLENARQVLTNPNEDWSKRANQLKLVRSVVLNSEFQNDRNQKKYLLENILELGDALELSIRDLRSQIVKEAAITCSFLVETFDVQDLKSFPEQVLRAALAQVAVSTKIIASSAGTLSVFLIRNIGNQNQNYPKMLNILQQFSSSKAKEQRRQLAVLLEVIVSNWDLKLDAKAQNLLITMITCSICDADGETRVLGRKVFAKLEQVNGKLADQVFRNLDGAKQKMLRDGATVSSSSSVNSDRENNQNISQKFLTQRSASAIDTNKLPPPQRPANLKMPNYTKIRSSGYGQVSTQTPPIPPPSTQSPIQRVASNLGSSSFVASLTQEQASNLQSAMDQAKVEMSREDTDELLLMTTSNILKACTSSSLNEKKEALKLLLQVLPKLEDDTEIKTTGDVLSRLLAEGNNTLMIQILEAISLFVRCYANRGVTPWLKITLGKLFTKIGTDNNLPNIKAALLSTQKTILTQFDPEIQLKSVCDFMCDPVHLLSPKARLALLEYLCLLFEEVWPEDVRCLRIDTVHLRSAIRKMFAWMFDVRIGTILMPACEKLVCALFAINAAEFTAIFGELSVECRDWAYRILQLNGQKEVLTGQQPQPQQPQQQVRTNNNNYYKQSSVERTFQPANQVNQSAHVQSLIDDLNSQNPNAINLSMANLHGMMCEGSFTLWSQFFDTLLASIFRILSIPSSEIRHKLALRILQKMCIAQASKLFDATDVVICKVLDHAVTSSEDVYASEDCLRILATHLPLPKIVGVSRRLLTTSNHDANCQTEDKAILILKMLTRVFQEIDVDELLLILDDVAPCFVDAYDAPSSTVRKCAVFGLVALVQRVGMPRMEPHLRTLNSSKLNLIDLYVGRAKSSESGTSSN